jgi:hypothetical protein
VGGKKRPASKIVPTTAKTPHAVINPSDFYKQQPAWRVGILQVAHPWGWHEVDSTIVERIRQRLIAFESMTWGEILVQGAKAHHRVKLHRITGQARDRLEQIFGAIDVDELVSLRLTGVERIWGLLDGNVLRLLWWDPAHQICPSLKQNT